MTHKKKEDEPMKNAESEARSVKKKEEMSVLRAEGDTDYLPLLSHSSSFE